MTYHFYRIIAVTSAVIPNVKAHMVRVNKVHWLIYVSAVKG